MSTGVHQTTACSAICRFLLAVVLAATASSTARAAEPPSLDEIKAQLNKQREKIESLYIEIKREEKPCVDLDVLLTLHGFTNKILLMNDEVHFAFKGDNRYHRQVWPPDTKYLRPVGQAPKLPPNATPLERERYKRRLKSYEEMKQRHARAERMGSKMGFSEGPPPDVVRAYNGRIQWMRRVHQKGPVQVTLDRPGHLAHWFGPPLYLMNVGLAILDPLEKEERALQSQRMNLLPDLFEHWPYSVSGELEPVDGAPCVVLAGTVRLTVTVGDVTEIRDYKDKLWLDLEHGLLIRQRERDYQGRFVRIVNSDFDEVLPGLWLPKKSEIQMFPAPGAPKELQGRPVMIGDLTLTKCVVNEVPDDLFDMVTEPGDMVIDTRDPKWNRP